MRKRRRRRERARVRTGRGMYFEKARQVHVRFVPFRSLTRGVSDDDRDVRRTWTRFEESIDTSLGRGTDSRMNANTTLVRRFTAPERVNGQKQRSNFPTLGVTRAKSRTATSIISYLHSKKCRRFTVWRYFWRYFFLTSYEYFDSSWIKKPGNLVHHTRGCPICVV